MPVLWQVILSLPASGPLPVAGEDFIMVTAGETQEGATPQINVVLNWFEELKERVRVP